MKLKELNLEENLGGVLLKQIEEYNEKEAVTANSSINEGDLPLATMDNDQGTQCVSR